LEGLDDRSNKEAKASKAGVRIEGVDELLGRSPPWDNSRDEDSHIEVDAYLR